MIGASTLIIDDKKSDGIGIAQALWRAGVNCCFIEYKEDILSEDLAKHSSVRVIFQDINLISSSTPSTTDFDQAVQVIDKLLYDDNGPWILATWSTWEEEFSSKLMQHLKDNLPAGKRPIEMVCMNKESVTDEGSGPHGEVRTLSDDDINSLVAKLDSIKEALPCFYKLAEWEKNSLRAAQKVIHEVTSIPSQMASDFDSGVAYFLNRLGIAGSSEDSSPAERCLQATAIINNLVANEAGQNPSFDSEAIDYEEGSIKFKEGQEKEWARRSSKVLHFDFSNNNLQPGAVYSFKKPAHYYSDNGELLEDLKEHYSKESLLTTIFDKTAVESDSRREFFNGNSQLVIIDITPPCDHANLKAHWRKMCVGAITDLTEHSDNDVKKFAGKGMNRNWRSPIYSTKTTEQELEKKLLTIDPRLIIHIPEKGDFIKNIEPKIFQLRGELFNDLSYFVGSYLSRPGISAIY